MTTISKQADEVEFDLDDVLEFIQYANEREKDFIRAEVGIKEKQLNLDFADRQNLVDIITENWDNGDQNKMIDKVIEYLKTIK